MVVDYSLRNPPPQLTLHYSCEKTAVELARSLGTNPSHKMQLRCTLVLALK